MPAASDYVTSYFLVFFVGALFGAVYQHTGAAESISKTLAGLCKGKFVAPIIMTITGILTYGGVSGFVVFFVIYPIALNMFKEANLTRRLTRVLSLLVAGHGPCMVLVHLPSRTLSV